VPRSPHVAIERGPAGVLKHRRQVDSWRRCYPRLLIVCLRISPKTYTSLWFAGDVEDFNKLTGLALLNVSECLRIQGTS
jgi:hypothetical protein